MDKLAILFDVASTLVFNKHSSTYTIRSDSWLGCFKGHLPIHNHLHISYTSMYSLVNCQIDVSISLSKLLGMRLSLFHFLCVILMHSMHTPMHMPVAV